MKRVKHYAGDVIRSTQLPHRCRWIRVVDFDPLGAISNAFSPNFATVTVGNSTIIPIEAASVRIDTRDFAPVYAHTIYRANIVNSLGYFEHVELKGNIEVEFGENGDGDPGPLRFGQVSSPFEFVFLNGNAIAQGCLLALPKSIKSMYLHLVSETSNISNVIIAAINMTTGIIPAIAAGDGSQSVWEPGAASSGFFNLSAIIRTRQTVNNLNQIPLYTIAPNARQVQLMLTDGGVATDDLTNVVFTRAWSPPAILWLSVQSVGIEKITARGQITCGY